MAITIGKFNSVYEIKRTNEDNGRYFFSPATMRSFKSRVHDAVYSGCVFVTSEKNDMPYCAPQPRVYTVRIALADGSIETFGSLGDYSSRAQAHREAEWLGKALRDGLVAYNQNTYKFETVKVF